MPQGFFSSRGAYMSCFSTGVLILPLYRLGERGCPCFIQALMLILQFRPQCIYLRFYQSEGSVGLLNNLVIAFLWSTRNQDVFRGNTGQGIQASADPLERRGNVAIRVISFKGCHGYYSCFALIAYFKACTSAFPTAS